MIIEQTIDIRPNHRLVVDLPPELPVGKAKIAITVISDVSGQGETADNRKSAFGCLCRFAAPEKIPGEKGAWERALAERYAKN